MRACLRLCASLAAAAVVGPAAAQLPLTGPIAEQRSGADAGDAVRGEETWGLLAAPAEDFACPPEAAPASDAAGGAVSLLNPKSRLKVHGGLDTLMLFSTSRPFPSGIPLFLLPDSPFGLPTNSFDLHARQSYLGALFSGPELGEFQTGAQILAFLQNDNLSQDEYGLLVYYAYGELKNEDWRFAAGLQQDVFNPVSPTVVYLTKLYASGNTGSYRGQLRLERFWQKASDFGVTLQAALSEPISTLVTGSAGRVTEDNGWPNVESRIEFGLGSMSDLRGTKSRPLELGLSGVIGQFRTTRTVFATPADLPPRAVIDTWGLGSDIELWATDRFGFRGEAYYGQGLGEYNGGVLQSFNSATFQAIRTGGGFGEVFCYVTDTFHIHVGYGVDAPDRGDLAPTQVRRNQTYFVNSVWDLSKTVQVGLEVDYRKTDYTEFQPNVFLSADGVIIASRFLWRF